MQKKKKNFSSILPRFLSNLVKNGKNPPVCDFEGIKCLQTIKGILVISKLFCSFNLKLLDFSDELISLKSKKMHIECDCVSNCDDQNFFVKSFVSSLAVLKYSTIWILNQGKVL